MAKRTKRKYGMKKMEPAVMTVTTNTPTVAPGGQGTFYCDLSQMACLLNRRFYRQGVNWAVAGIKVLTPGGYGGSVVVSKIPNTWVAFQAYKAAFNAWNEQQRRAIEDADSQSAVAAFRDFKIFADPEHVAAGIGANLLPLDHQNPAQPYGTGEWQASEIVIPNSASDGSSIVLPSERQLHMVGINVNGTTSRGIIEGYADSRAYPQSPDPVSPDISSSQNWLARMFDTGNDIDDVLENATDRNDNLPYPQVDYPGGATQAPTLQKHDIVSITATTVGGQSRIKGGNFPCGLIRFDWLPLATNSTSANIALQIDLVPGSHRGYMCESMLEA
jgi:hypothetical protein